VGLPVKDRDRGKRCTSERSHLARSAIDQSCDNDIHDGNIALDITVLNLLHSNADNNWRAFSFHLLPSWHGYGGLGRTL
jgi:hypothetical protein